MTRLNLLLAAVLVISGLYLVRVTYATRHLFVEVEKAQAQEKVLNTAYDQLQLEKRAQATPMRVQRLAQSKLEMRLATAAVTQYVVQPRPAASQPAAGEGAP